MSASSSSNGQAGKGQSAASLPKSASSLKESQKVTRKSSANSVNSPSSGAKTSVDIKKCATLLIGNRNASDLLRESEDKFHFPCENRLFPDNQENEQSFALHDFTQATVTSLIESDFSGVTHLCLSGSWDPSEPTAIMRLIASLIDGLASTLRLLKLGLYYEDILYSFYFPESTHKEDFASILDSINRLPQLHYLALYNSECFAMRVLSSFPQPSALCNLSILGRLHEFTIDNCGRLANVAEAFRKFAQGNVNLKSINIGKLINCFGDDYQILHTLGPNLLSKIKYHDGSIGFNKNAPRYREGPLRCLPLMTGLKALRFDVYHMKCTDYWSLIEALTRLKQLSHLELTFHYEEECKPVEPLAEKPQLKSVKELTLNLSPSSHEMNVHDRFQLKATFPELTLLKIHYLLVECTACKSPFSATRTSCFGHLYNQTMAIKLKVDPVVTFKEDTSNDKKLTPADLGLKRQEA